MRVSLDAGRSEVHAIANDVNHDRVLIARGGQPGLNIVLRRALLLPSIF